MGRLKTQKIMLNGYGLYLGVQKGCFIIKGENGEVAEYPLFEREIGARASEWVPRIAVIL